MSRKDLAKNIQIRETEDGVVTYRVRINHKGKTYSATRDTLSDAAAWRDDTKYRLKNDITLDGDVPQGDMRLGKATDKFIAGSKNKSDNTLRGYVWAQNQILKYFGENTLLSEITQTKVYDFVAHRQGSVGASKIRQELSFISMVYEAARAWDIDIPSPERNIRRPKKARVSREEKLERVIKQHEMVPFLEKILAGHQHKYITEDAYHKKFYDRNKKLYYYLIFLLHTGMRPSEAIYLRWNKPTVKEIKEARVKKYHAGYVDFPRGGFSNIGTKTQPRFVPGHPAAMQVINDMEKDKEGSFVFLPDDHGQIRKPYRYYRSAFETARANTILEDGSMIRINIDFYSFRHTARSRMAVCGVQDSAAETIIGHEGDKMQSVYTHYEDDDLIREIEKLDYPWLNL